MAKVHIRGIQARVATAPAYIHAVVVQISILDKVITAGLLARSIAAAAFAGSYIGRRGPGTIRQCEL